MNDLNPCPFCNTTPILQHTRETGFYIHCPTCQSYTHGVQWSREEALVVWNERLDPWVRIDPERPETLPPLKKWLLLSLDRSERGRDNANVKAMWDGRHYRAAGDWVIQEPFDGIPYAWQPWPEAAVADVKLKDERLER